MKFVSPRGHIVSTSIYILVMAHFMNFDILVKTKKSALLRVKNMLGFADDFIYPNVILSHRFERFQILALIIVRMKLPTHL